MNIFKLSMFVLVNFLLLFITSKILSVWCFSEKQLLVGRRKFIESVCAGILTISSAMGDSLLPSEDCA